MNPFFVLLSAVLFAAPLVHAATLSVLPPEPNDTCAVGPYAMYTGSNESFVCGFNGVRYTQSGNIVAVTTELLAPDPWMDGVGTWTFDLSHLSFSSFSPYDHVGTLAYAYAIDTENVTSLMTDPNDLSSSYGEYVTYPITATLYVAGVPLDPPASVPEPASFALVAAPVLLLMTRRRFRRGGFSVRRLYLTQQRMQQFAAKTQVRHTVLQHASFAFRRALLHR